MLRYDMIIIGFGKGGKTLAAYFAQEGKRIAMVEESNMMYGGTCINIACIPTKTLIQAVESGANFDEAFAYRDEVTDKLRNKNFHNLADKEQIDVYTAHAKFLSDKVVELNVADELHEITAETIVINTGALAKMPEIDGLSDVENIYDSTSLQELREQPKTLGIIGAGNIGLEFASMYTQMGSEVFVFNRGDKILKEEEPELAELAKGYLEEDGVKFVDNFDTEKLSNNDAGQVVLEAGDDTYTVDALLIATGRRANTEDLGLENTTIKLDDRGFVAVDKNLETNVPGIYAIGDINGGPQFTYISLDDFRIVRNHLNGDNSYNLDDRKNVAHTHFLNPPLASVGLTESEAKEAGYNYITSSLDVANMPRGHVNNDLRGRFKIVVNKENHQLLGASFLGNSSEELINLMKTTMDFGITTDYFADNIFTHPSMAENLNDLLNIDYSE